MRYKEEHTIKETAEVFNIGTRTVSRWIRLKKDTGKLDRKPLNRKPRKVNEEQLRAYMEEHPDAYMKEVGEALGHPKETIRSALKRMKYTLKKRPKYTKNGMKRGEWSIGKRSKR
jgi:transposase